ncbi:unnamed protein product [Vitrella brassicaformis CCMP3155]|uniref:Uncharacterized protein n=1 Tax=Vitrella brassicaformis (strain CCMP3155) TaxID=1169540 RepID=A0A0G4FDS6_VITBC|nr:unnamed protein product [Vitrella brassicaformis CCMP3155]|eukprot:CEM11119.1 unnamed protein product [Vitrella brassicaformis CCMP3155]
MPCVSPCVCQVDKAKAFETVATVERVAVPEYLVKKEVARIEKALAPLVELRAKVMGMARTEGFDAVEVQKAYNQFTDAMERNRFDLLKYLDMVSCAAEYRENDNVKFDPEIIMLAVSLVPGARLKDVIAKGE